MQIITKSGSVMNQTEQLFASVYIRQLNVEKIRDVCAKCGFPVANPDDVLDIAHRIRMKMPEATPAERAASEEWLKRRGSI